MCSGILTIFAGYKPGHQHGTGSTPLRIQLSRLAHGRTPPYIADADSVWVDWSGGSAGIRRVNGRYEARSCFTGLTCASNALRHVQLLCYTRRILFYALFQMRSSRSCMYNLRRIHISFPSSLRRGAVYLLIWSRHKTCGEYLVQPYLAQGVLLRMFLSSKPKPVLSPDDGQCATYYGARSCSWISHFRVQLCRILDCVLTQLVSFKSRALSQQRRACALILCSFT